MIAIGIDPGMKTGLAIWSTKDKQFAHIVTTDFWGAVDYLSEYNKYMDIGCVVIEKPHTKAVWHSGGHTTAVNVGSVLREAVLLIEYCKRNEIHFKVAQPKGKINAKQFEKITNWKGRTSQHARDAAMMIFNFKQRE